MSPDGTQKTLLVPKLGVGYEGVLSPDGKQLAYVSDLDGDTEIYLARADGSHPHALTRNEASDFDPAWSPDGARIAFASNRTGDFEVYTVGTDGKGLRRLTRSPGHDEGPDWSPDGRRIAFFSDRAGNADVYVVGADGRNLKRLTISKRDEYDPAWSPDRATIAYTLLDEDGDDEIWTMDASGAGQHRVIELGAEADWSPDGSRFVYLAESSVYVGTGGDDDKRIAAYGDTPSWVGSRIVYTRTEFARQAIAAVGADGTGERIVTTYAGRDQHPAWSPDGHTLVFSRDHVDGPDTLMALSDTGVLRPLLDLPIEQDTPAWSPDGTRIAFCGSGGERWLLFVLTLATGETRGIDTFGSSYSDWDPAWSPDGTALAFSSRRGGTYDIYVANLSTGGLRRVTSQDGDEWAPAWSPDGTTILFAGDAKGTFDIWAVPAGGGLPHRLTEDAASRDDNPAWSPDGQLVAFDRTLEDGTQSIYVMRPDGSAVARVTRSAEPASMPAWQPVTG